jgi:1-phosphatidylinositol-4-phosphate 5-kinase
MWNGLSVLLLSKGLVNALIWTRTSNISKVVQQLHQYGYVDLPPPDSSINWALRTEILLYTTRGICTSIEMAEQEALDGAARDQFDQIYDISLETKSTNPVVFYDYAPQVFRYLRKTCGISSCSYLNSLQQTTKERVSEGKSGAFFYFTQDRKYVVKTMTRAELVFLLEILPRYSK